MLDQTVASSKKEANVSNDPRLQTAVDHLRRMRYFRRQYDQRRALFYRQYLGQRDQRYFPDNITPRSNTFVPYPFSNTEEVVSRVMDAHFSFEKWFETRGRSARDEDSAESMGLVLHEMFKRSRLPDAIEQLSKNICIYGHSGIKVDWDWDYDIITYAEPVPVIDQNTGQPMVQPVVDPQSQKVVGQQPIIAGYRPAQKKVPRNRPKFTVIDVYDLLVDPDGGVVAHLTERTLGQLLREQETSMLAAQQDPAGVKQPLYDPQGLQMLVNKISAQEKDPMAVIVRMAELWNEFDGTQTLLTFGEDSEAISWKDLRASYRSATYSPYKRKVFGGEPILLYHGPNPFNHKKAPILYTSFIKLPNEIYGLGLVEVISDLTESLNKMMNMIVDNWNLGINRRYAYDTAADIDHEALNSFNVPGGKVGVSGDPNKVLAPLPFFTPNVGDYQILPIFKQMIEVSSGVSDFYSKGVGGAAGNKTATGINQVISESTYRFKMFMRNMELDIFQPLLSMCASLVQQFLADEIEIQITGLQQPFIQKYITLSPEDLIGTFDFDLVASYYANNKTIRQRTMLELINLLGQNPYINQYEALREVFKVFEIHNAGKILYTPEQVGMMQQQQMQQEIDMMIFQAMLDTESKSRLQQSKPQAPGGGQGAGGGRPRKFVIPKPQGAGLQGAIREFAQSHGSNAFGTRGNSRNRF